MSYTEIHTNFQKKIWIKTQHGHVAGKAFFEGKLLDEKGIDMLVTQNSNNILTILQGLNGSFSFILKISKTISVLASDRVLSYPFFYGKNNNEFCVSDYAENVRNFVDDVHMDNLALEEFFHAMFISGNDTLYPNVKQMQAGQLIRIDSACTGQSQLTKQQWWNFFPQETTSRPDREFFEKFSSLTLEAHERLIQYADGKQIVLPLSGGLDSRTIAVNLKKLKYDNIVTYSYGCPKNNDPKVSKTVAANLELPWSFVPYSRKAWSHWGKLPEFEQYLKYSYQYCIPPHIQEFPAVYELLKNKKINADAIFAPGHTDTFFGSQTPLFLPVPLDDCQLYKFIQNKYYSYDTTPLSSCLEGWQSRLLKRLCHINSKNLNVFEFSSNVEHCSWIGLTTKQYISLNQTYNFFGHNFYLPLCDAKLIDFSKTMPLHLRYNRKLQMDYVINLYAEFSKIPISTAQVTNMDRTPTKTKECHLKQFRHIIPKIIKYIKRFVIIHQNPWAWHYAFSWKHRKQAIKANNLGIGYLSALRALEIKY